MWMTLRNQQGIAKTREGDVHRHPNPASRRAYDMVRSGAWVEIYHQPWTPIERPAYWMRKWWMLKEETSRQKWKRKADLLSAIDLGSKPLGKIWKITCDEVASETQRVKLRAELGSSLKELDEAPITLRRPLKSLNHSSQLRYQRRENWVGWGPTKPK